ncbi:hypothetical protein, partial [Bittarella massiliensis (ex Durand et al. 2017)]|uniref:hypothetical protein n=1 Tax=Bittarella massiliensis (ex Durand et al. 2017) TaxID=1720313 RepID=UPI00210A14E5
MTNSGENAGIDIDLLQSTPSSRKVTADIHKESKNTPHFSVTCVLLLNKRCLFYATAYIFLAKERFSRCEGTGKT